MRDHGEPMPKINREENKNKIRTARKLINITKHDYHSSVLKEATACV